MYTLTCDVNEQQFEIASAIGYGCGMGGCVEEESHGGRVGLTFYFEREEQAVSAAASFAEMLSIDAPAPEYIDDRQDWNAKWRESMEPAQVAAGVWVSPSWLEPPEEGREAWIRIEPKMAFGTGHHETTRLAAKALIEGGGAVAGNSVIDIGTGSGVLCFVADYLGASRVVGVEIDADCRENLAENLTDNPPRAGGRVAFVIGTLDAICINNGRCFDVVIMNMLLTESAPLLGQIIKITQSCSILIWSGILADESGEAVKAAERFGFKLSSTLMENEWWCGTFIK
ncbi:MAG: 50S ribosomal protein L11 methyltransferase [Chitinispirillales bacterium]|jgi:ribosomal protein L11 methyltransferase|nr:50S ribosomal protein L11 methyltransferase [Chitinispirillales bacterium]